MKEYTLLAIGSACLVTMLDRYLGTRVTSMKSFWIALGIMFFFKIPTNGYLTWRPIVLYNPDFFLGFRLGTIPIEDFFYGYGLITLTCVLWEYFNKKRSETT